MHKSKQRTSLMTKAAIIFTFSQYNQAFSQNNGTKINAAANLESIQCISENTAIVEISTTITSTGSVDSARIETFLNGSPQGPSGWISPQDFTHSGRIKTAISYSLRNL